MLVVNLVWSIALLAWAAALFALIYQDQETFNGRPRGFALGYLACCVLATGGVIAALVWAFAEGAR